MGRGKATDRCVSFIIAPLLGAMLLAATPHPASAEGDAEAGNRLARTWCSSCHLSGPAQDSATSTGAPTFAAIAGTKSLTAPSLRNFLLVPHGRMPDLHLRRDETADLAAYILGLRKP